MLQAEQVTNLYKPNHHSIKEVLNKKYLNKCVRCVGWIRTVRHQSEFSFCSINDGSTSECLQIIVNKDPSFKKACTGCSISVCGEIVNSPAKGQEFELVATEVIFHGFLCFFPRTRVSIIYVI
mgnify:CR=1 FL=1